MHTDTRKIPLVFTKNYFMERIGGTYYAMLKDT